MAGTLEQRRFISKIEADFSEMFYIEGVSDEIRRARCFTGLLLTTKCGAAFSELPRFVVDGAGDLGLDGIYYDLSP